MHLAGSGQGTELSVCTKDKEFLHLMRDYSLLNMNRYLNTQICLFFNNNEKQIMPMVSSTTLQIKNIWLESYSYHLELVFACT
jgi:hypothetical protein